MHIVFHVDKLETKNGSRGRIALVTKKNILKMRQTTHYYQVRLWPMFLLMFCLRCSTKPVIQTRSAGPKSGQKKRISAFFSMTRSHACFKFKKIEYGILVSLYLLSIQKMLPFPERCLDRRFTQMSASLLCQYSMQNVHEDSVWTQTDDFHVSSLMEKKNVTHHLLPIVVDPCVWLLDVLW